MFCEDCFIELQQKSLDNFGPLPEKGEHKEDKKSKDSKKIKLQAKDISTQMILELLAKHQGEWAFWHENWLSFRSEEPRVKHEIVPQDFPQKVLHAKFKSLMKRGFIGGCDCGCRGDFEITDKGLEFIGQTRTTRYNGY